ncbi:toprim domain-containing protein [Streptomyces reniochalinae]
MGYDAVAVRGASLASNPELVAELAAGLKGAQVIVCGDNDTAGNGFTARLADGLAGHGVDVFTLEVPYEGADLTDWRNGSGLVASRTSCTKPSRWPSRLPGRPVRLSWTPTRARSSRTLTRQREPSGS